jgi:hypothetical protein
MVLGIDLCQVRGRHIFSSEDQPVALSVGESQRITSPQSRQRVLQSTLLCNKPVVETAGARLAALSQRMLAFKQGAFVVIFA